MFYSKKPTLIDRAIVTQLGTTRSVGLQRGVAPPREETGSGSIVQRDLFRGGRRAGFQEEGEISCDQGKGSEHEVADWRCTSFFSAKGMLIDPGACTEKKGGPSKDPVPGDHDESREKHARGRQSVDVALRVPGLWNCESALERGIPWVLVATHTSSARGCWLTKMTLTLNTDLDSDVFDFIDGAPFFVQHAMTVTRPPSPSFSFDDFSIVSPPSPGPDPNSSLHPRHGSSQTSLSSLRWLGNSTGDKRYNTPYRPYTGKSMKCLIPRLWGALSSQTRKGRRKATRRKTYNAMPSNISYADLQPLDGEEGELIDEACYVDSGDALYSPPKFADFLTRLPPEIAIYLLCFLDLSTIVACQSVSHRWNVLANDSAVWRELFYRRQGWGINLERAIARGRAYPALDQPLESPDSPTLPPDSPTVRNIGRRNTHPSTGLRADNLDVPTRLPHTPSPWSPEHPTDSFLPSSASVHAPLFLPWRELYEGRSALDARWTSGTPYPKHLRGHADSVYCLEFDSQRIISGSRDRTIKAWDIKTGRCLGTFMGHYGSVLCLKFEKDWDIQGDKKGFMVSGSSDRRACVWDIWTESGKIRARVRAVLIGHLDGVLDLRVDDQWIVSCSKDTKIRVWNRETLELHRTLSGHQGPVNAIGLQNGLVVSASGDTKMMLWDIERGTCLRTFDGDRGLACIEFKDNYIVSGSSDCQIKVWNATTGECIRTLIGHDALVRALALDPATGRLVSASYDKVVKVWDLRTGRLVQQFKQHHLGYIFDVKFDVHRIVSTSHDQRIVVLDFTQNLDAMLFT